MLWICPDEMDASAKSSVNLIQTTMVKNTRQHLHKKLFFGHASIHTNRILILCFHLDKLVIYHHFFKFYIKDLALWDTDNKTHWHIFLQRCNSVNI